LEQYFENKPHLWTIFFMSSISIYVAWKDHDFHHCLATLISCFNNQWKTKFHFCCILIFPSVVGVHASFFIAGWNYKVGMSDKLTKGASWW
jgi:hypothetical protein